MSDYEIRSYRPGDEELILEAWNRHLGGSLGPRGLDDWNWVHRANPAGGEPGPRIALALHGGRVVAHYASQPTRVITDGEEHVFSQVVDAFADPDHASAGGEAEFLEADVVLVSTGRKPYTTNLGLADAGVEVNGKGQVVVDMHTYKTNKDGVYAIGDIVEGTVFSI